MGTKEFSYLTGIFKGNPKCQPVRALIVQLEPVALTNLETDSPFRSILSNSLDIVSVKLKLDTNDSPITNTTLFFSLK